MNKTSSDIVPDFFKALETEISTSEFHGLDFWKKWEHILDDETLFYIPIQNFAEYLQSKQISYDTEKDTKVV